MESRVASETSAKATIAGMLDIAAGVTGLIGGLVLSMLGLFGGSVLGATLPEEQRPLAVLPLVLFLPLALLTLCAGAFAVAGGIAALQRRRWWLAVLGAVAALICFFPLGIVAVIVTVLAEREFPSR